MGKMANFAEFRAEAIAQAEPQIPAEEAPLVSAIIPCLNEELTLAICIGKALSAFAKRGIRGEVVIGDNGSTDRSVEIARALGARVVHQPIRGYGAAICAAAGAARGRYLIMADADDSYDWTQLDCFIDELESERRGFYGGAIGYLSVNGEMDTCIALRTALVKDGEIVIQAGGGVVADSDPEAEYQESNNKARALVRAAEEAVRFFAGGNT